MTIHKKRQTTFCYCPSCNEDLCSNNSFVDDTDLVRYECSVCDTKSEWDFDIAPVPILMGDKEAK
jgi:transposase-like protein